ALRPAGPGAPNRGRQPDRRTDPAAPRHDRLPAQPGRADRGVPPVTSLLGGDPTATVRPSVTTGSIVGLPLSPLIEPNLIRTVVDTHLHLPDMFELTFNDEEGTIANDAGLVIGQTVEIKAGAPGSSTPDSLIKGEI